MAQPPVTFRRRFACRDAFGRETWVEVELRDGELAVGLEVAGGFCFSPDQLQDAEEFHATFGLGLKLLQQRQQELALELGMEQLRSRAAQGRRGPRRHRKQRGPRS